MKSMQELKARIVLPWSTKFFHKVVVLFRNTFTDPVARNVCLPNSFSFNSCALDHIFERYFAPNKQ